MSHPIARIAIVLALFVVIGCAARPTAPDADLDPDAVYRWGASRTYLEDHYGPGHLIYCRELVPADDFAAATIRALVATGKPRPSSYEVFTRRGSSDGASYQDYVFFDDNHTVTYVARRRD
jgi:hypothetical protein